MYCSFASGTPLLLVGKKHLWQKRVSQGGCLAADRTFQLGVKQSSYLRRKKTSQQIPKKEQLKIQKESQSQEATKTKCAKLS